MRFYVVDKDLQNDDSVGAVVLTADELRRALSKEGKVQHVAVHDQNPQLLFVDIAVFPM